MTDYTGSRYATSAQWTALDPVLGRGVFAFSTDTGELVVGNGVDRWSTLTPLGAGGGGGTGGLPTRETITASVTSLAAGGNSEQSLTMAPQFSILKVDFGGIANLRLRVYASTAHRTADASRAVGTDPTGDHGLLMEFVSATGLTSAWLTPVPVGYATSGTSIPIRIDNVGGSSATATITLTWMELEV